MALRAAKDEIKNLKDEMQANKDHMLQVQLLLDMVDILTLTEHEINVLFICSIRV